MNLNIGENICLINEIQEKVIKGKLVSIPKVGDKFCLDNFISSTLVDLYSNKNGNWLKTRNSRYRLISDSLPSDVLLEKNTMINLTKNSSGWKDNTTLAENSISGVLTECLCRGKSLSIKTEEDTLLKTSNVVEVYFISNQIKLVKTISSLYNINLL